MDKSLSLFNRAKLVMPGGVNSPVRAYGSVNISPRFIKRAEGARVYDVDGREYIDYIGSWGPMILGHSNKHVINDIEKTIRDGISFGAATELEVEMAELITEIVPNIDMVRMVNSGTEAVMSAIRLARGYTKRDKILKFSGCYHGHTDSMLVKSGSGLLNSASANSLGVTDSVVRDTIIAKYNDIGSVQGLFDRYKNEISAVIVEPVAANMGVVTPNEGFLQGLRDCCTNNGALLIFDEVITGFRLALGGAQEYYKIEADIVTYGKIIGGGMPVGAYGARKDIMSMVAPTGGVYQAGTLSGNPLAMSAGLATLRELRRAPSIYEHINSLGSRLKEGLANISGCRVNGIGSLVCLFMCQDDVIDLDSALKSNTELYAKYFNQMIDCGIYIAPAQFEAMFISAAHTHKDVDFTVEKINNIIRGLQ